MMTISKYQIGIVLLMTRILYILACSDFSTEPEPLNPADAKAIATFEDTLTTIVPISTLSRPDSVIRGLSAVDLIDTLLNYNKKIAIQEGIIYRLSVSTAVDTTYLLLENTTAENVVFFYKNYVLMEIIDDTGENIPLLDDSIPYATIQSYYSSSGGGIKILINARYKYRLENNKNYIIKIITNDQTTSNQFDMVIAEDE